MPNEAIIRGRKLAAMKNWAIVGASSGCKRDFESIAQPHNPFKRHGS